MLRGHWVEGNLEQDIVEGHWQLVVEQDSAVEQEVFEGGRFYAEVEMDVLVA